MTATTSDATLEPPAKLGTSALPGYLLLFAALFCAYGTESAYLPAFLQSHGLAIERIGTVLAAGTVVRIVAGPMLGRLADAVGTRRFVLAVAAALAGIIGSGYLVAWGFVPLLLVCMAHSAAEATLAPLSDALAVSASTVRRGFQYGWVRGTGSAAFVGGTLLSGQLVDRFGLFVIIVASSALFLVMAGCATRVEEPQPAPARLPEDRAEGTFRELLGIPAFRLLLIIGSLVIGSHALNDAYAVITWRAAGDDGTVVSLLWSESVVAEVLVFFVIGPWLITRLGPAGCAGLSATAGILRWGVLATTTALPALISVQALHGLTFALFHLSAMRIIGTAVPVRLSATAQSVYGNFALGIASAVLTFGSGYLYVWFGLHAFWVMAGLCAMALPFTLRLRRSVLQLKP